MIKSTFLIKQSQFKFLQIVMQQPEEQKDEGTKQELTQQEVDKEARMKKLFEQIKLLLIVKMLKEDGHPIEILPNLFIGSMGAAFSKENLKSNSIKHILTVCDQKKPPFESEFNYKTICVNDSKDQQIVDRFEESNQFIKSAIDAGESILVHCFAGKSRSSSFIIAYLIKHRGMTLDEALTLLKSKRPIVQPNEGFMVQLKCYQSSQEKAQDQS